MCRELVRSGSTGWMARQASLNGDLAPPAVPNAAGLAAERAGIVMQQEVLLVGAFSADELLSSPV